MLDYNFKEFFDEKILANDDFVSNGYFIIRRNLLSKAQNNFINKHKQNKEAIVKIKEMMKDYFDYNFGDDLEEFIPDRVYKKGITVLIDGKYGIQEGYYNFAKSLGCKLLNRKNKGDLPVTIINSNNEVVGIVMPMLTAIVQKEYRGKMKSHEEYVKKSEAQKEKEQRMKKCLYINGENKAVIGKKDVLQISSLVNDNNYKNLYMENGKEYAEVFIDFGIVLMAMMRGIYKSDSIDDIKDELFYLTGWTLEEYKAYIDRKVKNDQFINVAEIKLMEITGEKPDHIQMLRKHRQKISDRIDKERAEEDKRKAEEDRRFVDEQNKIAENIVAEAEKAIVNKERVDNKDITFYVSEYDNKTTSLILYLMKKHGINVPIKTQGWINKALLYIIYSKEHGEYTYYYHKSSVNSRVFFKYLFMLVDSICGVVAN